METEPKIQLKDVKLCLCNIFKERQMPISLYRNDKKTAAIPNFRTTSLCHQSGDR